MDLCISRKLMLLWKRLALCLALVSSPLSAVEEVGDAFLFCKCISCVGWADQNPRGVTIISGELRVFSERFDERKGNYKLVSWKRPMTVSYDSIDWDNKTPETHGNIVTVRYSLDRDNLVMTSDYFKEREQHRFSRRQCKLLSRDQYEQVWRNRLSELQSIVEKYKSGRKL